MAADILMAPCCSKSIDATGYELNCRRKFSCRAMASAVARDQPRLPPAGSDSSRNPYAEFKPRENRVPPHETPKDISDEMVNSMPKMETSAPYDLPTLTVLTSSVEAATTTNQQQQRRQQQPQQQQQQPNTNNYDSSSLRRNGLNRNYDPAFVTNTVAQALITRLQRWCCQLFWLTIVCVIGCCSDKNNRKTTAEVRRDIFNTTLRRCKDVNELEVQLLRRLTSPSSLTVRPLRPNQRKRRAPLSRPPSPNLFAIPEAEERE